MYDNYIFDLYGTLVDIHTEEHSPKVWNKLSLFYRFYGADYSAKELKQRYFEIVSLGLKEKNAEYAAKYSHESFPELHIEDVFEKLYLEKGITPSKELIVHTGQLFRIESIRHLKLYPNVKRLLYAIKKSGKKIYLLSNAQRVFTEYEMNALGLTDFFDGILISSDEGVRKPDILFFNQLKVKYDLDFKKSIMIGNDSYSDIQGATNAGMDALYVRSNISPQNDPTPKCKYTFEKMDIKEIAKTLGFEI